MRMIPSNIMSDILGMGYNADNSSFYNTTALDYKCIGLWDFLSKTKYQNTDTAFGEVKNSAPFAVNGNLSTAGVTHSTANGNIELDGTTGFVDFGNYYNFAWDEPFSISAWVNIRSSGVQTICSKWSTQGGQHGWRMITVATQMQFQVNCSTVNSTSDQTVEVRTNSTFSTGVRHFVATYDGLGNANSITLYVNGTVSASTLQNHSTNADVLDDDMMNNSPMYIGRFNLGTGDNHGDIVMNELAIWNRELSSSNVTALYNGGAGTTIKFINHVPDVAYMVHMIKMSLTANHYFTNSDINIVYNDGTGNQTYLSRGFTVPSIEYSASPTVDQVQIEMDNVDLNFSQMVLAEEVRGKTVTVSLASLNKVPQVIANNLLFSGVIDSVEVNRDKAMFTIVSHMYLWQKPIPKRTHSSRCQWTFRDAVTCKYAAADTVCDKSYDDCSNKSNTANFGGFRWLPSLIDKEIWWGRVPR